MRRVLALLTGVGVTAAMVAAVAPSPAVAKAQRPAASTIAWGQCDDGFLQSLGAECGYLSVPLDYAHPNATQIQLAVSRIKHTVPDSQYQGVMLTNPGGPGGSGLTLSVLGQFVPNNAGDYYDWIGFDPRGVGSSRPALSCRPNYFGPDRPEYIPYTPSLESTWLKRSRNYAESCGTRGGALLD